MDNGVCPVCWGTGTNKPYYLNFHLPCTNCSGSGKVSEEVKEPNNKGAASYQHGLRESLAPNRAARKRRAK